MRRARASLLVLAIASTACFATAKPNIVSPRQQQLFQKDQVGKNLDALRDAAIAASEREFPLISDVAARQVLLFVKSMNNILIADEIFGWQQIMASALDQLDKWLHGNSVALLDPYLNLVRISLAGATPR